MEEGEVARRNLRDDNRASFLSGSQGRSQPSDFDRQQLTIEGPRKLGNFAGDDGNNPLNTENQSLRSTSFAEQYPFLSCALT